MITFQCDVFSLHFSLFGFSFHTIHLKTNVIEPLKSNLNFWNLHWINQAEKSSSLPICINSLYAYEVILLGHALNKGRSKWLLEPDTLTCKHNNQNTVIKWWGRTIECMNSIWVLWWEPAMKHDIMKTTNFMMCVKWANRTTKRVIVVNSVLKWKLRILTN